MRLGHRGSRRGTQRILIYRMLGKWRALPLGGWKVYG